MLIFVYLKLLVCGVKYARSNNINLDDDKKKKKKMFFHTSNRSLTIVYLSKSIGVSVKRDTGVCGAADNFSELWKWKDETTTPRGELGG